MNDAIAPLAPDATPAAPTPDATPAALASSSAPTGFPLIPLGDASAAACDGDTCLIP